MSRRALASRAPILIFDLDDTLYPEWQYVLSGFKAVAGFVEQARGVAADQVYAELATRFRADRTARCLDEWLLAHSLNGNGLLEPMLAVYREHAPALELFCDAHWAVEEFGASCRLALLTDGRSVSQRNKLRALGVAAAFEQILVSDEMGEGFRKPGDRGFSELLRRLDADPAEAAYVADNPAKDFVGPRRLGMATVRVRRRCGLHHDAEAPSPAHLPDAEVSSLFGLPTALPGLLA